MAVQICVKAFVPDQGGKPASGLNNRMQFRRSSDPHRKKREVVYSKGLVRSVSPVRFELLPSPLCGSSSVADVVWLVALPGREQ